MLLIIYRILLLVSWPKEILVKIDHLVSHVSKLALEHKCQLLIWSVKGKAKMCGMQRDISMLWFSMGVLVVKSKNVLASAIILLNLFLVCKVFLTLRLTIVFLVLYFLLMVKMPTSRSHMLKKCLEKFQLVLMTCKSSIFFVSKIQSVDEKGWINLWNWNIAINFQSLWCFLFNNIMPNI